MTDEELDREWKPSGRRPQSTIARSFSQELMDIFRIENSVADLDEQVDKRKQQISTQATELEALEARIREMEERLKAPRPSAPAPVAGHRSSPSGSPRHTRAPVNNTFAADQSHPHHQRQLPHHQYQRHRQADEAAPAPPSKYGGGGGSRPGTARTSQQAVPGALPPTPGASEGEYELPHPPRPPPSSSSPVATAARTTVGDSASADFVFVDAPDGDDPHDA